MTKEPGAIENAAAEESGNAAATESEAAGSKHSPGKHTV